jgi:hypothetical protein
MTLRLFWIRGCSVLLGERDLGAAEDRHTRLHEHALTIKRQKHTSYSIKVSPVVADLSIIYVVRLTSPVTTDVVGEEKSKKGGPQSNAGWFVKVARLLGQGSRQSGNPLSRQPNSSLN